MQIISFYLILFCGWFTLFMNGVVSDSTSFNLILNIFYKPIRMVITQDRSTVTVLWCSQYEIDYVIQRFPYIILAFDECLKYLAFWIKPKLQIGHGWWRRLKEELISGIIFSFLLSGDLFLLNRFSMPLLCIGCRWHGSLKVYYP